jgi:hypothetical protein
VLFGLGEVEALLTMNSATALGTSHNTEGALFNGATILPTSGLAAETELLAGSGMDGVGNPPTYVVGSRSAAGTMQPQGPWDSPALHGKVYVIEYDLRTWLCTPTAGYNFITTAARCSGLHSILHSTSVVGIGFAPSL